MLTAQNTEMESNPASKERETPQTMDLCTVITMFNKIDAGVKTLESRFNQMQQEDFAGKTAILTQAQQTTDKEVKELRKELELCKINNLVLNGTVSRLSSELAEVKNKLDMNDTNRAKQRMIVIAGFEASDKKDIMMSQLQFRIRS